MIGSMAHPAGMAHRTGRLWIVQADDPATGPVVGPQADRWLDRELDTRPDGPIARVDRAGLAADLLADIMAGAGWDLYHGAPADPEEAERLARLYL